MQARTAPPTPSKGAESTAADPLNEVRLRGRISGSPDERLLPSGDTVVMLRLVVPRVGSPRPEGKGNRSRKPGVDTLDCAIWPAVLRRKVAAWGDGDNVELGGSLHRRFWRAGAGVASRYEVEVRAIRRLRRAKTR